MSKSAKNRRLSLPAWIAACAPPRSAERDANRDSRVASRSGAYEPGMHNPRAKLADAEVARLRRLYVAMRELGIGHNVAARGLGVTFRVHMRTVSKYVYRERRIEGKQGNS